jgi:hypothetical protein
VTAQSVADWLAPAFADTSTLDFDLIHAALDEAVKNATASSAIEWVRMAHERPVVNEPARTDLIQAFVTRNEGFIRNDDAVLLRCVAAAGVAQLLAAPDDRPISAALAIDIGARCGWKDPSGDLRRLASERLSVIGLRARDVESIRAATESSAKRYVDRVAKAATAVTNGVVDDQTPPSWPLTGGEFKGLVSSLAQAVAQLAGSMAANAETIIAPAMEELDVLWWLYNGHSRMKDASWGELAPPELAVVAGLELAALTAKSSPIPNANQFLSKALAIGGNDPAANGRLSDAVSAFDTETARSCADGRDLGDLYPVHLSLLRRSDTAGKGWHKSVRDSTGFGPAVQKPLLDLALLAYEEALLLELQE